MVHSLIPEGAVGADLSCTSPIDRPWFSSTNFPNAPLRAYPKTVLKQLWHQAKTQFSDKLLVLSQTRVRCMSAWSC